MQKLIPWFVNNSVAANLLMLILIAGGLLALPQTHQEEFPTLDVDAVNIQVPYLGAAPAEVESAVCVRIEEAIEGTEGIDKVVSEASEGVCSVTVELVAGVNKPKASSDIESKGDAIGSCPAETGRPGTGESSILAAVFQIAISGPAGERTLKLVGEKI
ncbi:MAG: efflux RND transporter permease subunit, partial [Halieaceae bacterium]|nr:efflux RND transporter permease subunit [Halieaceae bacterium]